MARGISEVDVLEAADKLLAKGERPTIERVRLHLGRGSPNTVNRHLDTWWASLSKRMAGGAENAALPASLLDLCGRLLAEMRSTAEASARSLINEGMAEREEDRANVERMLEAVKAEKLAIAGTVEKLREDLNILRIRNEGLVSDRARLTAELEADRKEAGQLTQRLQTVTAEVTATRVAWAEDVTRARERADVQQVRATRDVEALREELKRQRSDAAKTDAQWRERVAASERAFALSNSERRTLVADLKRALAVVAKERERRSMVESQLRTAKLRSSPKPRSARR